MHSEPPPGMMLVPVGAVRIIAKWLREMERHGWAEAVEGWLAGGVDVPEEEL